MNRLPQNGMHSKPSVQLKGEMNAIVFQGTASWKILGHPRGGRVLVVMIATGFKTEDYRKWHRHV